MKKVFSVFAVLLLAAAAFAQTTNGTIAGSVVDPSGAAIAGATITATSLETGEKRTASTSKVGGYRIEALRPGNYKIGVSAGGFATTTVDQTAVTASTVTSVNVTLTIGSATASVEVSAEAVSALKTDNGELSDTLSSVEVNNLPVSSLNPYQLAVTLPGVTTVTGSDFTNGFAFSVNGNRPRDNNFLVESVDNNDQGLHGQAFQPNNIEAVQEITFLLDSFSAEYGRGGAVSNMVLKSGGNQFHGAAYERLLNSALNGTDKGDVRFGAPKVKSRENLFGFRVSGPILHDRAFFFVSNQWDRFRGTANLGTLTLPTTAGFATLQQYASRPQVANLLKAYGSLRGDPARYASSTISLGKDPITTLDRGTVQVAGIQRSLGNSSDARELEATSDIIVSTTDRLRFRFIQAPQTTPFDVGNFPNQLPNFDTQQSGPTYNAGINHTHIFSPNVLNELRLAYSRIGFTFDLRPETKANPLALSPTVAISGVTGYGIPTNVPQGRFQNTYQLEDALSWTHGSHSMKFGFDVENQRLKDLIPFIYYGSESYLASKSPAYTGLANFIDDFGGPAASAQISFGNPVARAKIWVQNYFAQDSWKIAHNFTMDYGLRYEYDGTPFNFIPNPAFNPANPAAFPGGVPQLPNKKNLAPRFGFNYSGDGKTVISGGVGLFYSHIFANVIDNILGSSPNDASKLITSSSTGRGTSSWSTILSTITNKNPLIKDTSNVIPQKLLDPITYEYNLRLQRQLPGAFVVAAEYVGNRGEHEYASTEFNPTINNQLASTRIFPTRGRIILQDNSADSNYNSVQAEIQHRQRGGLTFRGVYTYSKLLDDGSEIFTDSSANLSTYPEVQYPATRRREYAPSSFDHRHRIVVSAVYQPPVWHTEEGMHWAGHVVNGWMFSGISSFQSGQPINPEIGFDWNGDGISNDRPILLNKNAPLTNWAIKGDDPIFGFGLPAGTLCDGPRWWSTSDDCQVVSAANTHWVTSFEGTTQNTVARNYFFADHQSRTDFSAERSFRLTEKSDFMIRGEALNVFNHGVTGNYNATLISGVPFNGTDALGNKFSGTTTFGDKSRTVSGNRVLRIYARIQF